MSSDLNYWKFFAGVGLFLYGMGRLEDTIKQLAGKRFKLFLKKYTKNRFLAISNGIVATAILQSSSIVLLMVIAFAGAGILSLSNSLGIILGANLGTTMTGWLVSTLGFGTKLDTFIFPMLAIGSLGLIFINHRFYFHHFFGLLVAMGLLFLGLDFMKESMKDLSSVFDVREIAKFGGWAFFLFGFAITAVIQSSSAMMTITLSALYANIITLEPAAYIAVGADLGTTITALLASFNGTAIKKRVGIAHFFFNIGTAVLALLMLKPILGILQSIGSFSNPMYTLVAFHSSFNLLGIIVFFPFLGVFEKFLNRFFVKSNRACSYIYKVNTEIPEASLAVIRMELLHFLKKIFRFNVDVIGLKKDILQAQAKEDYAFFREVFIEEDYESEYYQVKQIEDELLIYLSSLQSEKLEKHESNELNYYILALRNGVQSAKSVKDILHNFKDFRQSIVGNVENFTKEIHAAYLPVLEMIYSFLEDDNQHLSPQKLINVMEANKIAYNHINNWIYQTTRTERKMDIQAATFLNVNKEVYSANKLLIESMQDFQQAGSVEQIKG
jgi:phosphate:Na+ symporter